MGILDLIFPKKCLSCGKEGRYICQECLSKVKKKEAVCPYCKKASVYGMTHPKCFQVNGLDGLTSLYSYDGVIRKAILTLRYKYAGEVGKELLSILIKELLRRGKIFKKEGILISNPHYQRQENLQGFNQIELVGKEVARKLRMEFLSDISKKAEGINKANIVLFDDVFGTGDTMKEASLALKRNGAKRVWAMTIAR